MDRSRSQFSGFGLRRSGSYDRSSRLHQADEMDEYLVPQSIWRLYENKFKPSAKYDSEEKLLIIEVMEARQGSPLTADNYKPRLELLNQIEDVHVNYEFWEAIVVGPTLIARRDLVDRGVGGFKCQIPMYQLIKFSSIIKEDVGVQFYVEGYTNETRKLTGTVDKVDRKYVTIFTEKELPFHSVTKLAFLAERTTFKMEYRALEMLEQSVIEKVFFADSYAGNKSLNFSSFEWFRESIASNAEQVQAIRNIVNQASFPAPYILFGPPGTGKTSTLVEAIGQIYKLRPSVNVLAVATSNSAANEITSRLLEIIPEKHIFRFFARSCARKKKDIAPDVLSVSNLNRWSIGMDSKELYKDIRPCRVVICTASTAGRLVDSDIPQEHFSYIFIDECGSAKEISSLVPIMGIGVHSCEITASIVLAGDPKQLGPVIPYDFLNDTTHSVSLLERIVDKGLYAKDSLTGEYDPQVITLLRDNFRSHPALLEFSNKMFYDGQLRAKGSTKKTHWTVGWDRLPNRNFPLIFHSVIGQTMQHRNSCSMYNELEADQVLTYVETILKKGICGKDVEQGSIGVISPYASQVRHIKELLEDHDFGGVEVGSTEQYQGREKPIMIISMVRSRSNSAGFLTNAKRINVSLTRAQALMIVVGDPGTLEKIDYWKDFIQYCRKNGAIHQIAENWPVTWRVAPFRVKKHSNKVPKKSVDSRLSLPKTQRAPEPIPEPDDELENSEIVCRLENLKLVRSPGKSEDL